MLSSPNRLPKEDIQNVLRRGIHVRGEYIELVHKKTTGTPRFAFIVSTKIDKRATARNRMRRVMSEPVRHRVASLPPMDGILIAKKNFSEFPQTEVENIIVGLLKV